MFLGFRLPARLRRLLVAVAVGGLAMGLIPASSAAAPAAASVRDPSLCRMLPIDAALVVGDPAAKYPSIGGYYTRARGVAYKMTGQFPHSTTLAFTAYNDFGFIDSQASILNDNKMVPDRGSVNPFLPGNKVNAPNRNYTAWLWPDSVPVPRGLRNVVLFPTKSADPTDKLIRFSMIMRMYEMQPGYKARQFYPTIHAVSAANPKIQVRCPLSLRSVTTQGVVSFFRAVQLFGPAETPPEPPGNRVLFSRIPALFVPYPEGLNPDAAVNYLSASLDLSKISVITMHKVPTFFNNQKLPPFPVMGTYQARYMSQTITYFPEYPAISVNTNSAMIQPDGSWVTVLLPSEPRLPPRQLRAVRARAMQLGYNVIQEPPTSPVAFAPETLTVRQKVASPTFCCSVTQVPSWVDPNNPATAHNNYRLYGSQTSPAFFKTYTSTRANMGPYYINGVKETFSQFMQR